MVAGVCAARPCIIPLTRIGVVFAHRLSACEPVLRENFSAVGLGAPEGEVMIKESLNEWRIYASGRRFCEGFIGLMEVGAGRGSECVCDPLCE